jgi:hypothetical protein
MKSKFSIGKVNACILSATFVLFSASSCRGIIIMQFTSSITPTPTPSNTNTSTLTNTPYLPSTITETASLSPTVTSSPIPSPIGINPNWYLLISDTFDNNNNNWEIGTHNTRTGPLKEEIIDGKYRITLKAKALFTGIMFSGPIEKEKTQSMDFRDIYVSIEGKATPVESTTQYGIILVTDEFLYSYSINEENQTYQVLTSPESSFHINGNFPGIRTDTPNNLAIKIEGGNFIFYINGKLVGKLQNKDYSSARLGLIVFYGGKNEEEIEFDNFMVYGPR